MGNDDLQLALKTLPDRPNQSFSPMLPLVLMPRSQEQCRVRTVE
jgi:hypothetical protein